MAIIRVDVFGDSLALVSDDGSRETIRNGVYTLFDAAGLIVETRDAGEEDRARFFAAAAEFEASLGPISAPVREVEIERDEIEVEYRGGAEEEIDENRYKRKDEAGRTIVDREATAEDFARLEAAAAQLGLTFVGGADDRDDDRSDDDRDDDDRREDDDDRSDDDRGGDDRGGDDRDDRSESGRPGHDRTGSDRRDRLDGSDDDDTLDGGAGRDRLRGEDGDDSLFGGDDRDDLRGGAGEDTIFGGEGNDRARGGSGDDDLFGESGNDRLKGESGNDEIFGGDGNDRLIGNSGDDTLSGGDGNDRAKGGSGNDVLNGDAGNDRLAGGSGDDTLDGGEGEDRYNGGTGADTLIFAVDGAAERVSGFQDGVDVMDISAFGLTGFDDIVAEQVRLDVMIDLGGGDTIRLQRFDLDDLDASDFIF